MSLHRWIIAGLWLLFVGYWAVAGANAKRSASPSMRRWRWEIGVRLFVILLMWRCCTPDRFDNLSWRASVLSMSRKEQSELVTSGTYALIRHPIYMGLDIQPHGAS